MSKLSIQKMTIRFAQPEDAEQIKSVILCAGETGREDFDETGWTRFIALTQIEPIRDRVQNSEYLTLCYFNEKVIVGLIAIHKLQTIDQLFVIPEKRRQGIALELWNTAKAICIERGNKAPSRVKSSTQAVPVYESFGFRVTGPKETQDGVSFTSMEMEL